jgi:hypothetical protein
MASQTKDDSSWWSTRNVETIFESSALERRLDMKKASTTKDDQDIPELTREQLGAGVRGKYYRRAMRGSNVVVLQPEIQKAFPTSEAVNKALTSLLAFAKETQSLTARSKRTACRRPSV